MKISLCSHICNECGFVSNGTKDTLYAEAKDIMRQGILFPCHKYLRSITGSESHGTEHLSEVKVCRGYVAYMHHYAPYAHLLPPYWVQLFDQLHLEDFQYIYTPEELYANHHGLREGISLNNPIGSTS